MTRGAMWRRSPFVSIVIIVIALALISGAAFLAARGRLAGRWQGRWHLAGVAGEKQAEEKPDGKSNGKPDGAASNAASNEEAEKPGIDMSRTKLVGRAKGVKQWELEAREIRMQGMQGDGAREAAGAPGDAGGDNGGGDSPAVVVLEDIRGGVLFQEGKPRLRFEAARAEANPETGDFRVMGGVVLTSLRMGVGAGNVRSGGGTGKGPGEGPGPGGAQLEPGEGAGWGQVEATLRVPDLSWDARRERLECSGPVELETRGVIVRGERMLGNMKDRAFVIEGGVRIFRVGSDNNGGDLTCERAIYRFEAGTLEIVGESELNIDMG